MDEVHYKVRINGKIEYRALHTILGVNKEGKKEISGMYISQSEGANFWLVLTDLNNRGLKLF
jgi:putative transposase